MLSRNIATWRQFAKEVRKRNLELLHHLPLLKDTIFVSGCQRSGTTILTHVFMSVPGIVDYRTDLDSELQGALILSGNCHLPSKDGRYCFQTTYLNECYHEYYRHQGQFKMIYVIRNPYSVVYSMCYHWKRKSQLTNFALNELFEACGKDLLDEREKRRYNLLGNLGIPKLTKACLSYVGKVSQLFDITERMNKDVFVIDYDELIQNKKTLLPNIFSFVNLPYDEKYHGLIHSKSLKRADSLSPKEKETVNNICWDVYLRAKEFASNTSEMK